jgi:hypothetical protein
MRNGRKRVFAFICAVLFLSRALQGEETCPIEIKLLLSPPTIQNVIASLSFRKETTTHVYFFDTDTLELLNQDVIVRVRQGANNDLTVKVRVPEGSNRLDDSQLREHFPCEIDRTGAEENTSYSVARKYKTSQVPEMGTDVSRLLSPSQEKLLREARVAIDWARVTRMSDITATKWETTSQPPFRKLALELWEYPAGKILEISTKVSPGTGPAKYAELRRLANMKGLSSSAEQSTKTRTVLETLAHHPSSLR